MSIPAERMADILKDLQSVNEEGLPYMAFQEAHPAEKQVREDYREVSKAAFESGYQSALTDAMRRVAREIGA